MTASRYGIFNANLSDSTADRAPTPQVMSRTFPAISLISPKFHMFANSIDIRDCFPLSHWFSYAIPQSGMAPAGFSLLSIEHKSYYIQSDPKTTLSPSLVGGCETSNSPFVLATAIDWSQSSFNSHDLETICQDFSEKDDVWCRSFLSSECDRRQRHNVQVKGGQR